MSESSEALTRFTKQAPHPPSGHKSFGFGTKMRAAAPEPGSAHSPGAMEWVPTAPQAGQPAPKENQCFQRSRKSKAGWHCRGARVLFACEQTWQRGPSSLLRSVLGRLILGKEVRLQRKPRKTEREFHGDPGFVSIPCAQGGAVRAALFCSRALTGD